jgi:hypothetical protein
MKSNFGINAVHFLQKNQIKYENPLLLGTI